MRYVCGDVQQCTRRAVRPRATKQPAKHRAQHEVHRQNPSREGGGGAAGGFGAGEGEVHLAHKRRVSRGQGRGPSNKAMGMQGEGGGGGGARRLREVCAVWGRGPPRIPAPCRSPKAC